MKYLACSVKVIAILLAVLTSTVGAQPLSPPTPAQRFSILRMRPPAAGINYFNTEGGFTLPHLTPSVGLFFHYDHRPLRVVDASSGNVLFDESAYQVNGSLLGAIGLFDFLEMGIALPFTVAQDSGSRDTGEPGEPSLSGGIGDLRLIPKVRAFTADIFTLGAAVLIELPTGSQEDYLSDGHVIVEPRLIMSLDHPERSGALNFGYRIRKEQEIVFSPSQTLIVDDEFYVSLAARFALAHDALDLIVDGQGFFSPRDQGSEGVGGEILGGLRFHLPVGFAADIGAGPGFGDAVGIPMFRVFGALSWTPASRHPSLAGGNDRDKDGIPDNRDSCPDDPEDFDGFEDEDGCPDLDNDKDGVADLVDKCPMDPEDLDGVADADGCPETDADNDTIPDDQDRCPLAPETFNDRDDVDGCPDRTEGDVQVEEGKITTPRIHFEFDSDRIKPVSYGTLRRVAWLMRRNPWIDSLRVEGHADARGPDPYNQKLSEQRAASVRQFLIDEGIKSQRLDPVGFGERRPRATNTTDRGRFQNRRVEFLIIPEDARR